MIEMFDLQAVSIFATGTGESECIILVFVNKQALYQTAQSSIQMAPIFSKQRHFFNCPVIKMIYVSLPDYNMFS
jgi:hypothetical protein